MAVTGADQWAGQELRARRGKKKLTQAKLGELAGVDRETIVKLEGGTRRISPSYAKKLAPHLGLKDHRKLLPPQDQSAENADSPLARLAAAEKELADLKEWVRRGFAALEDEPALQDEVRRALVRDR